MKKELTQEECVLKWWRTHKYISTLDAFNHLYILDLQGRIKNLKRRGYDISYKWVFKKNLYGKQVHFKKYFIVTKGEDNGN